MKRRVMVFLAGGITGALLFIVLLILYGSDQSSSGKAWGADVVRFLNRPPQKVFERITDGNRLMADNVFLFLLICLAYWSLTGGFLLLAAELLRHHKKNS